MYEILRPGESLTVSDDDGYDTVYVGSGRAVSRHPSPTWRDFPCHKSWRLQSAKEYATEEGNDNFLYGVYADYLSCAFVGQPDDVDDLTDDDAEWLRAERARIEPMLEKEIKEFEERANKRVEITHHDRMIRGKHGY